MAYTYSLQDDFSNNFNKVNFKNEVNASNIVPKMWGIKLSTTNVIFYFSSSLTTAEKTTLDNLVANHDSTEVPVEASKQIQITMPNTLVDTPNYTLVATFKYPGNIISSVSHIQVISNMDPTSSDYTVRIKNHDNNDTIVEQTFTNTDDAICNFDTIANLPSGNAIFDVHMKCQAVGNDKIAHIKAIIIHYN